MLKNSFMLLILLFSSSYASTLDDAITSTIKNNKDLKSIKKSIDIANEQIKLSSKWDNPILTIGANDIHFDTSKRDLEPMQSQFIGISQNIPINDKLKFQKEISLKDKRIQELRYEDAILKLKSTLINYAYNIKIDERKYELLEEYQNNIKKLEDLTSALYESNNAQLPSIINLQTMYHKVQLEKENLKNIIQNAYLNLEKITYKKIDKLNLDINIKNILLDTENIITHPKLEIFKHSIQKSNSQALLEESKKFSDIKVNLAYFQRDAKYKDYANISFSFPLAYNDKENIKTLKAKLKSKQLINSYEDEKQKFEIELKILENSLSKSYKKYRLIKEQILPLLRKNQINLEEYNSIDLVQATEILSNLNKIIRNRLSLQDELKDYFFTYSKLYYYLQGNIK